MLLFVYGPYMNPEYLHEKGITVLEARKARLSGYDICFSTRTGDWRHAMIDLAESQGRMVEGVLYKISSDAMDTFDDHEKVAQKKHRRIEIEVQTEEGIFVRAFAFVSSCKEGDFIPSTEYLSVIVKGAVFYKLSKQYIDYLLSLGEGQNH